MPIYVDNGLAIPHGQIPGMDRPLIAFAQGDQGIPIEGSNERAELLFLVLTATGTSRLQARLLANINALFKKSMFPRDFDRPIQQRLSLKRSVPVSKLCWIVIRNS